MTLVRYLVTKALQTALRPLSSNSWLAGGRGWLPVVVREPYTGAWQRNEELRAESVLANFAVFACVTLIASDVAKLRLRLVEQDNEGVWHETTNPAYSPVLRVPNRYQTIIKFIERWIISKLIAGNTYVLKQRDNRGVVVAMYVLDPAYVTPMVGADGSVFYQLHREDLNWLGDPDVTDVLVPASEILHDLMCPIFHPLCGVTPLFACGASALQALNMQKQSSLLFANGARPGGILTAPGHLSDDAVQRAKEYFDENYTGPNVGRTAVLGDGLKYEGLSVNAVDSQFIEQLRWTGETVCSCYHVPPYMVGIGPPPPYANVEPLLQQYYSQCIQSLLASFEATLDKGLEFPRPTLGTEFDINDLLWMDTLTRTKAAADAIGGAVMSPDEARLKYFGLGSVKGGASPMAQQQYYSLAALAERDADKPFAKPTAATPPRVDVTDLRRPRGDDAPDRKAVERMQRDADATAELMAACDVSALVARAVDDALQDELRALRLDLDTLRTQSLKVPTNWAAGTTYNLGDVVTHRGSLWVCLESHASARFDHERFRLIVKHGRDGGRATRKDG